MQEERTGKIIRSPVFKTKMKSKIESLGVYLPKNILTTSDLMKRCNKQPRWDLEKLTGISERRVSENEGAVALAVKAAQNALYMSEYEAKDIELIVVCSISRVYDKMDEFTMEPSLSLRVKKEIGADSALNFDVVNACAGMFTGVMILDSYIKSGAVKNGIVVSGEYITLLADNAAKEIRHSLDGQLASLTVGDCGAALIMDKSKDEKTGFHFLKMVTGSKYNKLCVAHPSKRGPGAVMLTKPIRLQKAAMQNKDLYCKEALDKTNWSLTDIDLAIPHQTSVRAIKKGVRVMSEFNQTKLPEFEVINVEKYGNTSSTTHTLALHEMIMTGRLQDQGNVLFLIQASGLNLGHATYTMDDLPERYLACFGKEEKKYA